VEGKNVAQTPTLNIVNQELLSNLTDPTVIHEHLERIGGGIERNDPAQAIGSSKELIESTAELVRGETGVDYSERDDVPEPVRKVRSTCAVAPRRTDHGDDQPSHEVVPHRHAHHVAHTPPHATCGQLPQSRVGGGAPVHAQHTGSGLSRQTETGQ